LLTCNPRNSANHSTPSRSLAQMQSGLCPDLHTFPVALTLPPLCCHVVTHMHSVYSFKISQVSEVGI